MTDAVGADEWIVPRIEGLTTTFRNGVLRVRIARDGPFYVCLRRPDMSFRNRPAASSFDFRSGTTYEIAVAVGVSGETGYKPTVIEYPASGDKVHFKAGNPALHKVAPGTRALTLALRVEGRGRLRIGPTQIEPVRHEPPPPRPGAGLDEYKRAAADAKEFVAGASPLIVFYTGSEYFGSRSSIGHRTLHMMKVCAARGLRSILFPFGDVDETHRAPAPDMRQYGRKHLGVVLDAILSSRRRGTFVCGSLPDLEAIAAIDLLKAMGWKTVYELLDDMEEFNRAGFSKWYHPRLEERACRRADRVIAVNELLAAKARMMGAREVSVIGNGVDSDLLVRTAERRNVASASARRAHRRVGFIGHLTPAWLDWQMLVNAAASNPHIAFDIAGQGGSANLELPSNINLVGPKSHEQYLEMSGSWSVGLVPFRLTKITAAMDPLKIYEYLAAGLRVVVPGIGDLDRFPCSYPFRGRSEFDQALQAALTDELTDAEFSGAEAFLDAATWSARTDAFLDIVSGAGQ